METVCERLEGPGGVGLRWTSISVYGTEGLYFEDLGERGGARTIMET